MGCGALSVRATILNGQRIPAPFRVVVVVVVVIVVIMRARTGASASSGFELQVVLCSGARMRAGIVTAAPGLSSPKPIRDRRLNENNRSIDEKRRIPEYRAPQSR